MSEGSRGHIGYGYETREGVPGPILNYLPFQSEDWNPEFARKPNPNISSRGIPSRGRILEVPIEGSVVEAPDTESTCRIAAHMRGKVASSVLVAGAIEHVLTNLYPDDAAEAVYRETLNGVVYRDDAVPMSLMGGRARSRKIEIKHGEYDKETIDVGWLNYGETADAVADVGNTGTFAGPVYVRGGRLDPTDTVNNVLIEATTAGALDGTAAMKARVGVGALGGAETAIPVVARTWIPLIDDSSNPIGPDWDQPLEVYFDGLPTTTFVLADKYTIAQPRAIVAPTYSTRRVFTGSQAKVTILGVGTYVIEELTWTHVRPVELSYGVGSLFAGLSVPNGMQLFTLQFSRKYVDRNFVTALRSGASATYQILRQGDKLGATIYREKHLINAATADFDRAGTNIANANALEEQVVVSTYDDGSSEAVTETMWNTLASGTV